MEQQFLDGTIPVGGNFIKQSDDWEKQDKAQCVPGQQILKTSPNDYLNSEHAMLGDGVTKGNWNNDRHGSRDMPKCIHECFRLRCAADRESSQAN